MSARINTTPGLGGQSGVRQNSVHPPRVQSIPTPTSTPQSSRPFNRRTAQESPPFGGNRCYSGHRRGPAGKPRGGAVAASKGDATGSVAGLAPGCLVDFKKEDKHFLALVTEPDGRRNYWIVDQRGHRSSLPARSVSFVLPGGSAYTVTDLERFAAAGTAGDGGDDAAQLLELAWSIASDEAPGQRRWSLGSLSGLLYNSDAPLEQYRAYCLLQGDAVFFKQVSASGQVAWEPRSAEAVADLQRRQEQERLEREDRASFLAAVSAAAATAASAAAAPPGAEAALLHAHADEALAPEGSQRGWQEPTEAWGAWAAGPHANRVPALYEFALAGGARESPQGSSPRGGGGCSAAAERLARDSLALLGRRSEADAAWQLLADVGAVRQHAPLPLLRAGVQLEFAAELEAAAQELLAHPPPDPCESTRVDLTHLTVYTVDDAGTTEVDDGVAIEELASGGQRVWVHVANPTRWLQPGCALDLEARRRSRSLYLPFGSVPMFPRCLAEGPFSLRAAAAADGDGGAAAGAEPCCAVSIGGELGPDGQLLGWQLVPSRISVSKRLTYEEADADIALGPEHCSYAGLQDLYAVARLRKCWRQSRGCIDIELPEPRIKVPEADLGANAPRVSICRLSQHESPARQLVAEMMILAGEAAGRLGATAGLALPFRGQEAPVLPCEASLAALPAGGPVSYALRRCMTRGTVATTPARHASLGLDAYVQVTSPIRRYSDLLAHWSLEAHLRGEAAPLSDGVLTSIITQHADLGRELGRAEGDVHRYWAAEFFRQRRDGGEWDATVLGWLRREAGLASVLVEELGLEVVTKVQEALDAGDRVRVAVADVDSARGSYRLSVLGVLSSASGDSAADDGEEAGEGGTAGEEAATADDDALDGAGGGTCIDGSSGGSGGSTSGGSSSGGSAGSAGIPESLRALGGSTSAASLPGATVPGNTGLRGMGSLVGHAFRIPSAMGVTASA